MVDVANFVFNFQAEHLIPQELFDVDGVREFLESRGFQTNALGNLMAEFTDADTVRKIQGSEALKTALLDPSSRAGIVQHLGSQPGKNEFLNREIFDIATSTASEPAKTIAFNNLFEWTWKLAKGEIVGPNGEPLGVRGTLEFADILEGVYHGTAGAQSSPGAFVDPVAIDNYANLSPSEQAAVDRARATSQSVAEYCNYRDTLPNSPIPFSSYASGAVGRRRRPGIRRRRSGRDASYGHLAVAGNCRNG